MNFPGDSNDDMGRIENPPKNLSLDTEKNATTDIVSDYFKDHNYIKMAMNFFTLKIEEAIKKALTGIPGWRIKTYKEYYADYRGGESYYVTELSKRNIPTIDRCAEVLNDEIAKCEAGRSIDEERFKQAWNEASFAVFGNRNSQI